MRIKYLAIGATLAIALVVGTSVWADQLTEDVGFIESFLSGGGVSSGPIYMDGNSLCLSGDTTGHCVGAQSTGWEQAYNSTPYATWDSSGDLAFTGAGAISTTSNGDLVLNPHGTGDIDLRTDGGPVQIGDGTYSWTHTPTGLGVEGIAEFDSYIYADSFAVFGNAIQFPVNKALLWGALGGAVSAIYGNTSKNQLELRLDVDMARQLVIHSGTLDDDFDHAVATNPTVYFQSALDPDTDNTRWGSIHHDGTSASAGNLTIATGAGGIKLDPASVTDVILADGNMEVTGDLTVTGQITGFPHDYGEMYIDAQTDVATPVQNTWYEIKGFVDGVLESITHSNGAMTVVQSGIYIVHYSISATTTGVNKTYEFSISVDDVIQPKCTSSRKYAVADLGANTGLCMIQVNAGQVLRIELRNITDTTTITVKYCNTNMHLLH